MSMPSERSGRVAGIVLAAGSSSRLGTNKLLITLGMEPVVRRAARRAIDAGLSPVVVVMGFEADRVGAALEGLPVELVVNQDHAMGMHTSVRVGIEQVPADCDGLIIVLADMPLVTSAMLAELAARFRAGSEPLVVSRYGDVQAPPTLYSRALFPALSAAGESGGRRVIRDHRDQAAELRWPPELLVDLDRPEDVTRLREAPL
jgi:molybdenum cofactor cytidylyltransferase